MEEQDKRTLPMGAQWNSSMNCPVCNSAKSRVLEKRNFTNRVSRRRYCENGHRYSTLEVIAERDKNKSSLKIPKTSGITDYVNLNDVNKLKQALPRAINRNKLENIISPLKSDPRKANLFIDSLNQIINYEALIKIMHDL